MLHPDSRDFYTEKKFPETSSPNACINKHDQLTQAFHGLMQNLCIRTGAEICAGFYGSSVGLQHGRCAQKKLVFALLSKAKVYTTLVHLASTAFIEFSLASTRWWKHSLEDLYSQTASHGCCTFVGFPSILLYWFDIS